MTLDNTAIFAAVSLLALLAAAGVAIFYTTRKGEQAVVETQSVRQVGALCCKEALAQFAMNKPLIAANCCCRPLLVKLKEPDLSIEYKLAFGADKELQQLLRNQKKLTQKLMSCKHASMQFAADIHQAGLQPSECVWDFSICCKQIE